MSEGKSKKILVVDDEPGVVEIVRVNLECEGYDIREAFDGQEGWDKVRSEKPDLIILDVMMPKMSGLELLERIKADPHVCDVSVIILTVRAGEADVIQGLEKGAVEYLTKPFDPLNLVRVVKKILEESDRREGGNDVVF
jgi:two-component system alkaline phosphatase synthesis response regulator PhoP